MKKIVTPLLLLLVFACTNDHTFTIGNDYVGALTKTDKVADLEGIFVADSVVFDNQEENKELRSNRIKVFEKGGALLMTLTPSKDSVQTVENIRIEDPRFVSEEGVGLESTFKDIQDNYEIKKILTALNNIVITVKGSPIYFTISKEELPSNLRFSTNQIEAVQIPDEAKIKYVMVSWDN